MSTQPKDGGPAFPRSASETKEKGLHPGFLGMTLRQYYKAAAVSGLLASGPATLGLLPNAGDHGFRIAIMAATVADAMLIEDEANARKQSQPPTL